jgi:formate hydrogenlyase transcriptional activator
VAIFVFKVTYNVWPYFAECQILGIDGQKEIYTLSSAASDVKTNRWLLEHGPQAVASLICGVVPHLSTPVIERLSREVGADFAKLLLVRDSFAISDESAKSPAIGTRDADKACATAGVTASDGDLAPFLLDAYGRIATWYAGAERIYGYKGAEVAHKHLSFFCTDEDASRQLQERLNRVAVESHACCEEWQVKRDASRFRANLVIGAIKDEHGDLRGFAVVVRDFSDRHQRDEKLRRVHTRSGTGTAHSGVVGVVSGELDRITEASDTFLELVGYSRQDLRTGRLYWPALTPREFRALDEVAHEEGLRFGACAPFEKELIRKDGKRIPVLVTTAVLKMSPSRWITFVSDLRDHGRRESIEDEPVEVKGNFEEIIGTSVVMKRVLALVEMVAPTTATVLVLGETGTGKELLARAIHRISPRRNLPFISLNCAAIPTGLLESELFGYERGAFTGALSQKIGRFELANHGTLFLDEVGDIPLDLQPKLLRALQEKSIERLGGTRTIPIDVRLVASTNRDLTQMMADKVFRSDLYYRLKVFPITPPPLRDRPEDIPILARHFTRKYAARMGRIIEKIPADTMKGLVSWQWPGNVRELENFIERSVILSRGSSLRAPVDELIAAANETTVGSSLEEVEREYIRRVLRENGGIVSATATRLRIPRTTLNALMTKLAISRNDL